MAKITLENYKESGEVHDKTLHVKGVIHNHPSGVADSLERILATAKAMWPNDAELKKVHIVRLNK